MKKSSFWLVGTLAVVLATLAVAALIRQSTPTMSDGSRVLVPTPAAGPSNGSDPTVTAPTPTPAPSRTASSGPDSTAPSPSTTMVPPDPGIDPPEPVRSNGPTGTPGPFVHHRNPHPPPGPGTTPAPSASPEAALKSYLCPTCGALVTYDPTVVGTRMLTCWNCATVFFADDTMTPLDPAHVPRPSATPNASAAAGSDPFAAVDATLQKMDWGQMAFDVPERLRKDQTALIHLLISPNQSVEQLGATIRAQATEPVRVEPAQLQITDLMEAKLVGSAFDIQSITPDEPQMVGRSQPTEWKWEIRPRQTGRQSLHLTINAIVRYKGEKTAHPVRTFDRVIEVEVAAAPSFYERHGRWLLPVGGLAVLAALAGAGVVFLRRGRRPGSQRSSPPIRPPDGSGADLFVSYSRRDEEQALAFAGRLQGAGYKVWIDQRGIDGATLWAQEISEAIRDSKVCVLFASAASFGSANVTREISLACEEGKSILPLMLEPVSVPSALRYQLAGIQQIELFRGEPEENFQRVVRALERLGVARPTTKDAP